MHFLSYIGVNTSFIHLILRTPVMPKIKISPVSLLLIPLVLSDPTGQIADTLISVCLHELGHLAAIIICGVGFSCLNITPYGLEITTSRPYRNFYEEIAVDSAGCAVNFICWAVLRNSESLSGFAGSSLILGTLNALPVLSLDGGEVLFSLLSVFLPYHVACKISRFVSFITLICMWTFAAYIFLFSGYNYSLFIMTVWLFGKILCH